MTSRFDGCYRPEFTGVNYNIDIRPEDLSTLWKLMVHHARFLLALVESFAC